MPACQQRSNNYKLLLDIFLHDYRERERNKSMLNPVIMLRLLETQHVHCDQGGKGALVLPESQCEQRGRDYMKEWTCMWENVTSFHSVTRKSVHAGGADKDGMAEEIEWQSPLRSSAACMAAAPCVPTVRECERDDLRNRHLREKTREAFSHY